MAKFTHRQTDFGSGELADKLSGRIDLQEYARGLHKMRGFYPTPTGGANYCPGSRFVPVNAAFGKTFHKYFDPTEGEELLIALDGTSGAFDIEAFRTTGANIAIDSVAVRTAINLLNIELTKNHFSFAQVGEILIITHNSGLLKPIVLSREGVTLILRFYDVTPNRLNLHESMSFPFDSKNIGTITIRSTGMNLEATAAVFSGDDVGTWFRMELADGSGEAVFFISEFNSTINVVYNAVFSSTGYTNNVDHKKWARSTWSQARGWPKIVTIIDGRTVFSNNDFNPTGTWVSHFDNFLLFTEERYANTMPDEFLGYDGTLLDTDAFSFTLSSGEAREIRWSTSQRSLHLGTDEGEYVVTEGGGTFGAELGFSIRQQTAHGSSFINASKADRSSIYVSRDGTRIRNFVFSEENGSYLSQDLSLLSEDLIKHLYDKTTDRYSDIKIEKTIWDRDRFILWVLTNTGALTGVAIIPSSNTVGWFARPIGGGGIVNSIAEVVDPITSRTLIFLNVTRGGTNTVEFIGPNWESDRMPPLAGLDPNLDSDHLPYFSDNSIRQESDPLEDTDFEMGNFQLGDEVVALQFKGGTYKVTTHTVVVGALFAKQIVIADEPDYIITGFPYEGTLESMILEAGGIIGNAQPLVKMVEKLFIRVYKSLGGQMGSQESNLKPLNYRNIEPDCAFTGDLEVLFPSSTRNAEGLRYLIKQNQPLPFNITAVFMRGETQG